MAEEVKYNSSYTGPQMDNAFAAGLAVRGTAGLIMSDGNGGVSAAILDSKPTDGSSNLVDSNAVYDMVMGRTKIYTAACSTAAGTAAKVATLDDATGFSLTAGVTVAVRFTYGNSATTPTLRVDGSTTGTAKTIAIPSSVTAFTSGNGTTYNTWGARETILFTYTGTYWVHLPSGYLGYLAYKLANDRQAAITANGLLKGDGSGGVSAAVAGTDYATPASIPTKTSDLTNDSGFLTSHQDISGKQNKITASGVLQGDGNGGVTAKAVDTAPASGSSNLITSGAVYNSVKRADAIDAANTSYGTKMARAIYAGTSDMTPGVTALTSGVLYVMYEETT